MIHIVKSTEAKQRNSFGVSFDLLAIGPQSMVTKMRYRKDNLIPFHSHPNEQSGYLLSGRIRVLTRDTQHELGPGERGAQHRDHRTGGGGPGVHAAAGGLPITLRTPHLLWQSALWPPTGGDEA
jgi:hypothetical protein